MRKHTFTLPMQVSKYNEKTVATNYIYIRGIKLFLGTISSPLQSLEDLFVSSIQRKP